MGLQERKKREFERIERLFGLGNMKVWEVRVRKGRGLDKTVGELCDRKEKEVTPIRVVLDRGSPDNETGYRTKSGLDHCLDLKRVGPPSLVSTSKRVW